MGADVLVTLLTVRGFVLYCIDDELGRWRSPGTIPDHAVHLLINVTGVEHTTLIGGTHRNTACIEIMQVTVFELPEIATLY